MRQQDYQYFIKSLIDAAEKIEPHYFQLPVAEGEEPKYRERVYCYELYHQLRCILGDNFQFQYKLNGEVDKRGHPIFRKAKKPDFIVHSPGDMKHNLVVIEVIKQEITNIDDSRIMVLWHPEPNKKLTVINH
jgi:hypothetical protein